MTARPDPSLNDYVVLAAYSLVGDDPNRKFTAEELLVEVWELNPEGFGLRGFERKHPDANKLYTKLDGKSGLVAEGILRKVGQRVYRLTPKGIARAARLRPGDQTAQTKMDRVLQEEVSKILSHPVFADWLRDSERPRHFRDAGHFWGIAPGTPASHVRERVAYVENTLQEALKELDRRGTDAIVEERGRPLFDRKDVEKCLEFQRLLKNRFNRDLTLLDPSGSY